ncbi:MAG: DUF6179 domain-containing protein [Oscillospiraceae bacterium]
MNIEKIAHIDRALLSEESYFQSLLEQAHNKAMISSEEIAALQNDCLELLASKIQKFTNGQSSSVREKVAKSIMESNIYTIGLYLKSFSTPEEALQALKEHSIPALYTSGSRRIKTKLSSAKHLHYLVQKNMLNTGNIAYKSSLVGAVNGFFLLYNPDYEATQINITFDYPTSNPINEFIGVEYVDKYLKSIYYENLFCSLFSDESIEQLLLKYSPDYEELVFNIFDQVLICAIECIIVKSNVRQLIFTDEDMNKISAIFHQKSSEQTEQIIYESYTALIAEFEITNTCLQEYIKQSLHTVSVAIAVAVKSKQNVITIRI